MQAHRHQATCMQNTKVKHVFMSTF